MRLTAVAITLTLGLLLTPLAAEAQQPGKLYRIGVLTHSTASPPGRPAPIWEAFQAELGARGYVEGRNLTFERRYAEGKLDRLPDLAAELVRLKVDILLIFGTASARAAKEATTQIPIVMGAIGDAVHHGLVASLARPGGNITGNSLQAPELTAKRLEVLKEAVPGISRVAFLGNPGNVPEPALTASLKEWHTAARSLALEAEEVVATQPSELENAFVQAHRKRVGAVVVFSDPVHFSARRQIDDLALKYRLATVAEGKEFAEAGALLSCAPSFADLGRRAAVFVDKILKGAKPADLPVEQPTRFELVINLKTAKALGLTIPQSVLIRADEVIQ